MIIVKERSFNPFNRFVAPALSIVGSAFMIYAAFLSHGTGTVLHYLVVYAVIMIIGLAFSVKESRGQRKMAYLNKLLKNSF